MAWQRQANVPGGFADEAALLAGLQAGRREAFEALHGGFAAPIYNLALRIVDDPHDAQDVAQEVLIKVFRGLPHDEPDLDLTAWLYRVTVNASFDHVRARGRRPAVAMEDAPECVAPVDEYERAELAGRVDSTLRSLPKRQQVALVLRDVHGLSVGETASALGVTRGSADVLLSRARKGFRRLFLAHDAEAPAARARCRVADETLAGSVGGGISAERRAGLLEHARSCPDCRRTVELWGVAPVGLGLLVHQVALPAKLSLAATFAAASAAGVAIPAAGLGAAGAVSAAGSAAAAAGSSAGAAGAGLLTKVGAAVGIKAVAIAAAATVVVGTAGFAGVEVRRAHTASAVPAAAQRAASGSAGVATVAIMAADRHTQADERREARAAALERQRGRRHEQSRDGRRSGRVAAGKTAGIGGDASRTHTAAAGVAGSGSGSGSTRETGAGTSGSSGGGGSATYTGGGSGTSAGTGTGSGGGSGGDAGTDGTRPSGGSGQ